MVHVIILVAHGPMAPSMIKSAEMILGKLSSVYGITLNPGDSPENLRDKVEETITKQTDPEEGVLILVDLPGATPFNVSAKFAHEKQKIAVVSGLNLPMLIEVALQNQGSSLEELERLAKESGKSGIRAFSDLMNG